MHSPSNPRVWANVTMIHLETRLAATAPVPCLGRCSSKPQSLCRMVCSYENSSLTLLLPVSSLHPAAKKDFEGLSTFWDGLSHDFSVVNVPNTTLAIFTRILGMNQPGSQCSLSAFCCLTALKVTCSDELLSIHYLLMEPVPTRRTRAAKYF